MFFLKVLFQLGLINCQQLQKLLVIQYQVFTKTNNEKAKRKTGLTLQENEQILEKSKINSRQNVFSINTK